jgi:hypothetical protein
MDTASLTASVKPMASAIRRSGVLLEEPNELDPELMNVCGLNPWDGHNSAARKQMFSSHVGQCLVIKGSTERRCQSGTEREFGKYTFSTKVPVDCEVIKVIDRYRETFGQDTVLKRRQDNPHSVIIYENVHTKEIGCINITTHTSYHSYFGFRNAIKPALSDIRVGSYLKEGTILADSPSVTDTGGYKYGRECNVAYMSHPATSEDGIMISAEVLKEFGFKKYETRVVEFGSKAYPLNLYGDEDNFKAFPDIGEFVREDGVLMALRPHDKDPKSFDRELAIVEQGTYDLMEIDHVFDKMIYADGAGGRVIDIRVHHDTQANNSPTPIGMDAQADRYDRARRQFYSDIVYESRRLERERKESLRLTPEFHRLVVEALSVVQESKERIYKLYRKAPLDDWRIEFTIEYDVTPTIGFKLTDTHGGKGVICNVVPADHMPVDADGNRADIVMDPNSTVSRMNLGRKYEIYINAHSRDVAKQIRAWFGIAENDRQALAKAQEIEATNKPVFDHAWNYLMRYYEIVAPVMHSWFDGGAYLKTRAEHLAQVIRNGIYLHLPTNNPRESSDIVRMLEASYPSTYGPVTYVGNSGRRVTTKVPVRIGSVYIILLEKIADDWTAVSSGKTQHYGVLSQVTNADKHALPYRAQSIRAWGEAEKRILASYVGPRASAEVMDRNNNPQTHEMVCNAILDADQPTNIHSAVDRSVIPYGNSRPLQLVKHILACAGVQFVYRPYSPPWTGRSGNLAQEQAALNH